MLVHPLDNFCCFKMCIDKKKKKMKVFSIFFSFFESIWMHAMGATEQHSVIKCGCKYLQHRTWSKMGGP